MLKRIISGCQTGVDLGALYAGQYLGLETGGWACQGWVNEDGCQRELMEGFGLKECKAPGYAARTEANVREGDGTLIVSPDPKLTGGSYMTMCLCEAIEKPYLVVWPGDKTSGWQRAWLKGWGWVDELLLIGSKGSEIKVLNVAGPRASKWKDGQSLVFDWLVRVLEGGL